MNLYRYAMFIARTCRGSFVGIFFTSFNLSSKRNRKPFTIQVLSDMLGFLSSKGLKSCSQR